MSNLTPTQLREIATFLDKSANAIDAYQSENYGNISDPDHDTIDLKETNIRLLANRLRAEAINLSIENSAEFLQGVNNATEKIENVINTIESVGKVINLATSVAALGISIVNLNPDNAKSSLEDIIEIFEEEE